MTGTDGSEGLRVIGYAIKREKHEKHVSQTLIDKARAAGFYIKVLDAAVPLEQQGRLDVVLQKLRQPEWEAHLEQFAAAHPEVKVFDLPAATMSIRHRGTMLTMLEGEGWVFVDPALAPSVAEAECGQAAALQQQPQQQRYRVCVPTNIALEEGTSFAAAAAQLRAAGLRYPLLAKPVWADGREGSHALAVVGSEAGLRQLVEGRAGEGFGLPVLVQEYVEHGGCLFKVYVLGSTTVMVKRSSLQLPPCAAVAGPANGCSGGGARAHQQQPASPPSSHLGGAAADTGRAAETCSPAGPPSAAAPAASGCCSLLADARMPARAGAVAATQDPQQQAQPASSPVPAGDAHEMPRLDLELVTRVSAYPRAKSWGKWDTAPKGHGVASPPMWLVRQLAQRLRRHLGLNLFNFDVIMSLPAANGSASLRRQQQRQRQVEHPNGSALNGAAGGGGSCGGGDVPPAGAAAAGQQGGACEGPAPEQVLYLIDINYFPGYEKLPGYEDLMVQFFSSIWAGEGAGAGGEAPR